MGETDTHVLDALDELVGKAFEENMPVDGLGLHPQTAQKAAEQATALRVEADTPHPVHPIEHFKGLPITEDASISEGQVAPIWEGGVPTCYAAGDVDLPTQIG